MIHANILNTTGQLGTGNTLRYGDTPSTTPASQPPVDLGAGNTPDKVICGPSSTCVILTSGALKCFGFNVHAQLGMGVVSSTYGDIATHMGSNLPSVNVGTGRRVVSATINNVLTCAVLDNGLNKCWGNNNNTYTDNLLGYGRLEERLVGDNGRCLGWG